MLPQARGIPIRTALTSGSYSGDPRGLFTQGQPLCVIGKAQSRDPIIKLQGDGLWGAKCAPYPALDPCKALPSTPQACKPEPEPARKFLPLTSLCLRWTVIRGEPDRFWDSVGGGDTSREIRWLATDIRQSLQFTASGILGNQWKRVTNGA